QLAELHGGSVRVTSAGRGRGSTFTVLLPIPSTLETAPPPLVDGEFGAEPGMDGSGDLSGIRVLVVDDEADARELAERILTASQAEVRMAESAAAALELIDDYQPHVLVSDIGMPRSDGYELIREVRRRRPASELPALALTAYARSEERQRALSAGFQEHVA